MEVDQEGDRQEPDPVHGAPNNPPRDAGWWDMKALLKHQKEDQERRTRELADSRIFTPALEGILEDKAGS